MAHLFRQISPLFFQWKIFKAAALGYRNVYQQVHHSCPVPPSCLLSFLNEAALRPKFSQACIQAWIRRWHLILLLLSICPTKPWRTWPRYAQSVIIFQQNLNNMPVISYSARDRMLLWKRNNKGQHQVPVKTVRAFFFAVQRTPFFLWSPLLPSPKYALLFARGQKQWALASATAVTFLHLFLSCFLCPSLSNYFNKINHRHADDSNEGAAEAIWENWPDAFSEHFKSQESCLSEALPSKQLICNWMLSLSACTHGMDVT